MSKEIVETERHPPPDGPLAKLMSQSTMHIDVAACIRNFLGGIAAIVFALNQYEIDISALLQLWSGN
jgi:hypothetical protein